MMLDSSISCYWNFIIQQLGDDDDYQMIHFFSGFIGLPTGHWKASAKGGKFCITALTRTSGGACGSV